MITHHPSPEMLADFAAGALRLSHALCISAHLDHCRSCRQAMTQLELVGAHLFTLSTPKSSTDSGNLARIKQSLLDELDDATEPAAVTSETSPLISQSPTVATTGKRYRVPKTLGQFIEQDYETLKWSALSPSIKLAVLCKDRDGSQIALTRVKAGGRMPHHSHTGNEITVVLEGAFSDETGLFKKGDMICRDARHKHTPRVTNDAECICLAVLDSPIQFTGFFTRLLNPIVRRQHA